MRTSHILSVLLFSYLFASSNAASSFVLSSSDTSVTSTFPVALVLSGTTTSVTTNPSATLITAPTGTSNAYTARFTSGIPLNQQWALNQDTAAAGTAIGATVTVTLGSQVAVNVVQTGTTTAGSNLASAAAVLPSLTTCGNYFLDCQAGTVIFNLYVAGTQSATCIVNINQYAAIVGILQFATASVPTTSTVNSAVTTANGGTNAVTTTCSTQVVGTNTLYYFISTFGSATGTDQTTNYNKVRAAAALGSLGGNTAYYTANLQTGLTGGSTAPSTQASSLTAISKSSTKLVAAVGLLTTVVATLFGFAL